MCGISGVISKTTINIDSFVSMNQIIKHRGPDDEGFVFFSGDGHEVCGSSHTATKSWSSNELYSPKSDIELTTFEANIGLGHRRLSILDLSPKGHQPMCTNDERYWITFNGEIYNYIEIREKLIVLGYTFNTDTDTEVILASFQEWGIECQHLFNGMWAFAIYDRQEKTLFLSRDRFGIKPLYYWFSPEGHFYFASEIKQFTVLPSWRAVLNQERALDYLYYAVLDHTDETLFKGVNAMLPGHCFYTKIEDLEYYVNSNLPKNKWYNPPETVFKGSFTEAKDIFLKKFQEAIKLHLRADVPVGSALSGGLDSSSIVSYVNILLKSENKSELQKTFSSCAVDQRFDERVWMDEVVKETNIKGHYIYPTGEEIFKLTEKIVWHLDEPYQSQAAFLSNLVFFEASNNKVTVLLNGQGADEYLSGYGAFQRFRYRSWFFKAKFGLIFSEVKSLKKFLNILKDFLFSIFPIIFLVGIQKYFKNKGDLKRVIGNEWKFKRPLNYEPINQYKAKSVYDISNYQLFIDPLQKYLKWEDRNSMAHSVEARVPFLDVGLVEFVRSLPVEYLDGYEKSKRVLVDAMEGILPEVVRHRKDKMGFITPEEKWFKEDYFDDFIEMFKGNVGYSKGLIDEDQAIRYFFDIRSGKIKFSYDYWRIICICVWMKVYNVNIK